MNDYDTSAPSLDDLRSITDHARFALDAKQCLKRGEELIGLTIAANEAKAAAEKAQAALAGAKAEHEAHCAERTAEADKRAALGAARIAAAEKIEAKVEAGRRELRNREERLAREAMRAAGVLPFFNERLQDLPSVTQTIDEYLASNHDADDVDGHRHAGEDADEASEHALPPEPGVPAPSQKSPRNGASRRAQA